MIIIPRQQINSLQVHLSPAWCLSAVCVPQLRGLLRPAAVHRAGALHLHHGALVRPPASSLVSTHPTSPFAGWCFAAELTTLCGLLCSQQMLQRKRDSFGELLQAASTIGDLRNCPVGLIPSPTHILGYFLNLFIFFRASVGRRSGSDASS